MAEPVAAEMAREQRLLTQMYARFDELRAERIALRDRYVSASDGTPGGRVERDLAHARHSQALVAMNAAEHRLCFGRLDHVGGESMHIGRMGIFDAEHQQLLMDWRAPAAQPFYVATTLEPQGIRRRRHIRTRRRTVTGVSDEILALAPGERAPDDGVAGESALLEALNAPRSGPMADIVATIQAEQDLIIRADKSTVLVVQGGPGTGKTAVALHRAAYLLYTYREQLDNRGVLVIGPNPQFLHYISQVLPSLGESAVVLATIGEMYPGVRAVVDEHPDAAVVKGSARMAEVIANAVLHRQSVSGRGATISYRGVALRLRESLLRGAQRRAWGSRRAHNRARPLFVRHIVEALAQQAFDRLSTGLAGQQMVAVIDLGDIRKELYGSAEVSAALAGVWPTLTAQQLLTELFDSPARLAWAAPQLTGAERKLLQRSPSGVWSSADVPLLDEAAELLGDRPVTLPERPSTEGDRLDYAEEVLEGLAGDEESLLTMLTAHHLADRHEEEPELASTAERAATDRQWTYGHVIVDEAQELSAMAWRMVMRRCPARSMTLVGDLAQTSAAAGAASWGRVLRPYVRDRWQLAPLTVNYRTPAEIMAVADRVLPHIGSGLSAPTSIRSTGTAPWHRRVAPDGLGDAVAAAIRTERQALPDVAGVEDEEPATRSVAVITPRALVAELTAATPVSTGAEVLTAVRAKGLEFDSVIVIEPAAIIAESPRGYSDLYVALTRATQRLGVLHTGVLPSVLGDLAQG